MFDKLTKNASVVVLLTNSCDYLMKSLFKCLNESFCTSIGKCMIWCKSYVFDTIGLHISCVNSAKVNWVALSDTECSGRPYATNNLISLILAVAVVDFISITLGHFECESTTIRKFCLFMEPAKFICILCHGLIGHIQGCSGDTAGAFLVSSQGIHDLTISQFQNLPHIVSQQHF